MTFETFIEKLLDPYRGSKNYHEVKKFCDFIKLRYKYPITPLEEATFLKFYLDENYSKSQIKEFYKQLVKERRNKIIEFLNLKGNLYNE